MRGHSGYFDIEVAGSLEIQNGMVEVVQKLASMQLDYLEAFKEKVKTSIKNDPSDVWLQGMNGVDVSFMHSVMQIFASCLASASSS